MKIIQHNESLKNTIITVGTFDGVHRGHQAIITQLLTKAKQLNLNDLIITFSLHPRLIVQPDYDLKLLTTKDEKILLLQKFKINHLYFLPFDQNMANWDAETFVRKILIEKFGLKHLIVGFDHRFGKNRQAGYNELKQLGEKYGFTVEKVEPVIYNGQKISSSRIRKLITDGQIKLANKLLGYNYLAIGKVIKGSGIGRKINFPTANILVHKQKLLPKYGVYAVKVQTDNFDGLGVLNYGIRPTISTDPQPVLEVHILDFNQNIYNHPIKIQFIDRIRDEKKFNSLSELQNQIHHDILTARKIFSELNQNIHNSSLPL